MAREPGVDDLVHVRALDLPRAEVHGHVHVAHVGVLAAPGRQRGEGHLQHGLPQRADEPGVLRDGDEDVGADRAALAVGQPRQRLETGQPAVGEVVHGLVGGRQRRQLVPRFERGAQHTLDPAAFQQVGAQDVVEHLHAVLAAPLGPVHRDVGVAQDVLRGPPRHGERHADAGRDDVTGALVDDRAGHLVADPPREHLRDGVGPVRHTAGLPVGAPGFQDDDELVAADPGHGVGPAQHAPQAAGDLDEHGVARAVAVGVVDPLEPVEITEQDGHLGTVPLGAGDGGGEPVEQQRPVRQPGQRVVQGRVLEVPLGVHDLRHVPDDGEAAQHRPVGGAAERRDVPRQPPVAAAGVEDPEPEHRALAVGELAHLHVGRPQPREVRLGDVRRERDGFEGDRLLPGPAEQLPQAARGPLDPPRGEVHDRGDVR